MSDSQSKHRLDWAVHITLLGGLLIGAALLIAGAALVLATHESRSDTRPEGVAAIFSKAARGDGLGILELGILILILTPVSRVTVLAGGWLIDRQWRFGMIAVCVLALLVTSLLLGTG